MLQVDGDQWQEKKHIATGSTGPRVFPSDTLQSLAGTTHTVQTHYSHSKVSLLDTSGSIKGQTCPLGLRAEGNMGMMLR